MLEILSATTARFRRADGEVPDRKIRTDGISLQNYKRVRVEPPYLGSQHNAARSRSSGTCSIARLSAACARAAASDRRRSTGQTDRQTDIRPLRRPRTMRAASAIITGALPAIKPVTTAIRIIARWPLENNPNVS